MRMHWMLAGSLVALAAAGVMLLRARGAEKEGGNVSSMVVVRLIDERGRLTDLQRTPKVVKTDEEWRRQLTPEQYRVARGRSTEAPFCGNFHARKEAGIYACVCCGLPLFKSDAKFESGTGWPSFFEPIARENITERQDATLGMRRTEILCARCDAHLGHVFDDGPAPSGLRYCLNSAALKFTPVGP